MANWSMRYSYTKTDVQAHAPLAGGVYRLINEKENEYYVFYVGQSDNLQRRLLEHLSDSEQDPCIKKHLRDYYCYYRFVEVISSVDRKRIEREQIVKYKPDCNG